MANYNFIGADGKPYGPYSAEQMRGFMSQNQLTAQSQVSVDGGAWQAASSYPELAAAPQPATVTPPVAGVPQPMGGDSTAALAAVKTPAICMMIVTIIILVVSLILLLFNLLGLAGGLLAAGAAENEADAGTGLMMFLSGTGGAVLGFVRILTMIIVIVGANKMRKLQSYGWSMTASILSILCCFFCLGLIPGIWSIVVLCKPEVKAAFH